MLVGVLFSFFLPRQSSPAIADLRSVDLSTSSMPVKPHQKGIYDPLQILSYRDYFSLKHICSLMKETKSKSSNWES